MSRIEGTSYKKSTCTACNHKIIPLLSLGKIPIVNYFPSKRDLKKTEKKFPLILCLCTYCGLVQLNEIVNPGKMFTTYHYSSSTSSPLVEHLTNLANMAIKRFAITDSSKVLDIGCNDGALLEAYKKTGATILGIDPAKNITMVAKKLDIPVIADFFTEKLAQKIEKRVSTFDLIFATNTVAQIPDTNDMFRGIKTLLSDDGVFIAEVGYLVDMISKKTFDSMYHEHIYYYSVQAMQYILDKNGLVLFDAERISNHGGSIRIFATHKEGATHKKSTRLAKLLSVEKKYSLLKKSSYAVFVKDSLDYKKQLLTLLKKIKKEKKSIVGIGAPAKGVVVLNFCGVNNKILDYVTDSTSFKQGRFIPGVGIPVFSEEKLKDKRPDYFFLLAWTYKDVILKKLTPYTKLGTKVIIPFPKIRIK